MKKVFCIILLVIFTIDVDSQVQLLLNDGKTKMSINGQIDTLGRIEIISKKSRKLYVDTSDVFAIISNSDTLFLYTNEQFPLSKAKYFVLGQQAGYNYKNTLLYTTGALVGFVTPIALKASNSPSFLSPIIAAVYVASTSSVGKKQIPPQYLNNEDFVRGYKLSATSKKVKNLSIFTVTGLVVGVVFTYVVVK